MFTLDNKQSPPGYTPYSGQQAPVHGQPSAYAPPEHVGYNQPAAAPYSQPGYNQQQPAYAPQQPAYAPQQPAMNVVNNTTVVQQQQSAAPVVVRKYYC